MMSFYERFRRKKKDETLMDEDSRKNLKHDQRFGSFKEVKINASSKIKNFHADKIRAQKGDEITIHWQTL